MTAAPCWPRATCPPVRPASSIKVLLAGGARRIAAGFTVVGHRGRHPGECNAPGCARPRLLRAPTAGGPAAVWATTQQTPWPPRWVARRPPRPKERQGRPGRCGRHNRRLPPAGRSRDRHLVPPHDPGPDSPGARANPVFATDHRAADAVFPASTATGVWSTGRAARAATARWAVRRIHRLARKTSSGRLRNGSGWWWR